MGTAKNAVTREPSGHPNVNQAVVSPRNDGKDICNSVWSSELQAIECLFSLLRFSDLWLRLCSLTQCSNCGMCRYHVPKSWLQPTRNLLVVFEELGGDSSKIALVKRSVSSVCADVSEDHPNIKNWQIESYGEREYHRAKVHLRCARGQSISAIKFASFGTPTGTCGDFQQGDCHSANSHTVLEKVCLLTLVLSCPVNNTGTATCKFQIHSSNTLCFHVKTEMHWAPKMRRRHLPRELWRRPLPERDEKGGGPGSMFSRRVALLLQAMDLEGGRQKKKNKKWSKPVQGEWNCKYRRL